MFNENPIISKWIADLYDQKVTETEDVDFLLSAIGQTPKRILEVCCGSGRMLVPLAKAGHTVSGFDADAFMLAKIPAKAEGLGNIQWRAADAVHDDWGTGFDVVVLFGNILYNIVSDVDYAASQELFLQKAAAALVPGGYVFIDYSPGGHRLTQQEESHKDSGAWIVWEGTDSEGHHGKMTLLAGDYDKNTRLDSFTRRFELTLKNGESIMQDIPSVKHFASLAQIHEWLSAAGFTIEQAYGDDTRSPITNDSTRAVIIAKKGAR